MDEKTLTQERVQSALQTFFKSINDDEHARYKSWEHCYLAFRNNQNKMDESTTDMLCLHLAFYLASWGMYRGSSFLLQKDYKVHRKAVLEMQNKEYNILRDADFDTLNSDTARLKSTELHGKLKEIYEEIKKTCSNVNDVSETLLTKILMGVFGCCPAYDRFVKNTIKHYGLGKETFSEPAKMLDDLTSFYKQYQNVLINEQHKTQTAELTYPIMKLIDCVLWQIGVDDDKDGKIR